MKSNHLFLCFLLFMSLEFVASEYDSEEYENEVLQDIPNLLTTNSTQTVVKDQDLVLYCQFNQLNDQIFVIWEFFNASKPNDLKMYSMGSTKISKNREYSVEPLQDGKSGMKLIIPQITAEDSGKYKCSINVPNSSYAVHHVLVEAGAEVNIAPPVIKSSLLLVIPFAFLTMA